ncbi:hypothetical protein REB14_00300 [Chryseobacterium sp. ES2]|uniref:Lipoprotein n=1 Tax=Chryseobacterium metallicongregator TaxID=3073042 RepID=A0ABU1DYL8_9FLAO|nr:hypothetical protein [Chryseobacterium sp. ES2]MDR4950616.1 hypothetical protein [Chryseobacterium sp. ES2]
MKNIIILTILFLFVACEQKGKKAFNLKYINSNNELSLIFENNTSQDIIFPAPNTLQFKDINLKDDMKHRDPIIVYATIKDNPSSKFYQKKLDSIYDGYLTEIGDSGLITYKKPDEGNSIFYLKGKEKLNIKYKVTVKRFYPLNYSSKFKQSYYPYDKGLKGNYSETEYLRRFSKLNLGKAKFVAQPEIEDSLFLNISQNGYK